MPAKPREDSVNGQPIDPHGREGIRPHHFKCHGLHGPQNHVPGAPPYVRWCADGTPQATGNPVRGVWWLLRLFCRARTQFRALWVQKPGFGHILGCVALIATSRALFVQPTGRNGPGRTPEPGPLHCRVRGGRTIRQKGQSFRSRNGFG